MPVTGTIDNDAALLRPLCPFMTDILPASFGANIVLSLCNVQRRPLTARLSQYPLRSLRHCSRPDRELGRGNDKPTIRYVICRTQSRNLRNRKRETTFL